MIVVGSNIPSLLPDMQKVRDFLEAEVILAPQQVEKVQGEILKASENEASASLDPSAIEALVLAELRPILPVVEGGIPHSMRWQTERLTQVVANSAPCVVRLDVSPAIAGMVFAGTGFLVGQNLVMTSRNVAELFATGLGRDNLALRPGRMIEAVFLGSDPSGQTRALVTTVVLIHPVLDIALLRIVPGVEATPPPAPMALSSLDPEDLTGRDAVVIGHMGFDQRRDMQAILASYSYRLGSPCASPGHFLKPQTVQRHGHSMWAAAHDCSTVPGYSGAPLIELDTGCVVGIQSGADLFRSFAIPIREILRDPHVVACGLVQPSKTDSLVSRTAWADAWKAADGMDPAADPDAPLSIEAVRPEEREAWRIFLHKQFTTGKAFADFLKLSGWERVVEAVPDTTADENYREGLLAALERRGQLETVVKRLWPSETQERAAPFEASQAPSPPVEITEASRERLPQPVLDGLLGAVSEVEAGDMQFLTIGSPHAGWLLRADGSPATGAETVMRLIGDPSAEARDALAWLVDKLLQQLGTNDVTKLKALETAKQALSPFARMSATQFPLSREPAAAAPVDAAFLIGGAAALRSVVLVKTGWHGGCTGWLLTPSLVVVPAHVITGVQTSNPVESPENMNVVLDFNDNTADTPVVGVRSIELVDMGLDLALLRLETPLVDRKPLKVAAEPPHTESGLVTMIHHMGLGPKKLSVSTEGLLAFDMHDALYDLPTSGGSGGHRSSMRIGTSSQLTEHGRVFALVPMCHHAVSRPARRRTLC